MNDHIQLSTPEIFQKYTMHGHQEKKSSWVWKSIHRRFPHGIIPQNSNRNSKQQSKPFKLKFLHWSTFVNTFSLPKPPLQTLQLKPQPKPQLLKPRPLRPNHFSCRLVTFYHRNFKLYFIYLRKSIFLLSWSHKFVDLIFSWNIVWSDFD